MSAPEIPTAGHGLEFDEALVTAATTTPQTPGYLGAIAMPPGGDVGPVQSGWRLALRSFAENKLALVGVGLVVLFLLFCFVGPHLYHTDQVTTNPLISDQAPSSAHPLGTDDNGFDELGRIMLGGQASLEIGFLTAAIASTIGTLYGTASGLIGGWFDGLLMRFVDTLLSIPTLFVVLILASRYRAGVLELSLVISSFAWLIPARLVRGEVLSLRERDFVAAAKVMGASRLRLSFRHLVPNALGVVIVNVTFQVADAILIVAALGFLGEGIQYPQIDWGDMLSGSVAYLQDGYWWMIYPVGAALVLVVMAANFIGDAARDAVEVRLRRR